MKKYQALIQAAILITLTGCSLQEKTTSEEKASERIRLNQVGFYPAGKKLAIVIGDQATDFHIVDTGTGEKVFSGKLSSPLNSPFSDKKTQSADFSEVTKEGKFMVVVEGVGESNPFEIKPGVFDAVSKASLKSFYFQRFSTPLTEQYAGKWSRPASYRDDKVSIHPSAASGKRKAGDLISSTKGWIDAGDYNKYIVNSGITTGTILSAYEDFESYYKALTVNIPESGNQLPDILDEALWNIRWMLTMQDPADGGVYHKCTNANFDGMVMPHEASTQRYLVQKGTAAALDFAAVTAQAARVFKSYEHLLPGLPDSLRSASLRAWGWAQKNPSVRYDQDKMNETYDPDVVTGEYGDSDFSDEFIWAAAELCVTTGDDQFFRKVVLLPDSAFTVPSWNDVKLLGYYSLIRFDTLLPESLAPDMTRIKSLLLYAAADIMKGYEQTAYQTPHGKSARDFPWGSNAVAANQAILLINAGQISGNKKYWEGAQHNLDYLLGRNATGYCYLTGFGWKSPMHIHHRPSEADKVADPVPGLLAGGPNPGMQDKCVYPSSIPDEAYTDDVCSYASNEVAINWNAPLVYLAGALEYFNSDKKP